MEDVFNKLNSKFTAYNWNKNSPLSNNETTEEIKNQIMAILKGCQFEAPVMRHPYNTETQNKNLAWFLPRPKPDKYKGGMPLYCEEWLVELAREILQKEKPDLLNVFCGMNKLGTRIDINPEVKPDWIWDIHKLGELVDNLPEKFAQCSDVILADPPYSDEEAKTLYGTGKLNYKKWTAECDKLLRPGGLLIVYHKYVMPNPNPEKYEVAKRVFVGSRTYHLPRVAIYFRKKATAYRRCW